MSSYDCDCLMGCYCERMIHYLLCLSSCLSEYISKHKMAQAFGDCKTFNDVQQGGDFTQGNGMGGESIYGERTGFNLNFETSAHS